MKKKGTKRKLHRGDYFKHKKQSKKAYAKTKKIWKKYKVGEILEIIWKTQDPFY